MQRLLPGRCCSGLLDCSAHPTSGDNGEATRRPDGQGDCRRGGGPHEKLHMVEIAEAQQTDPIIRWFVEQVARPLSQGRHPKVRATPDMHAEAKTMLQQKNLSPWQGERSTAATRCSYTKSSEPWSHPNSDET